MLLGTIGRPRKIMPEGIAALAGGSPPHYSPAFSDGGHFSRMGKQSSVERRILMGLR